MTSFPFALSSSGIPIPARGFSFTLFLKSRESKRDLFRFTISSSSRSSSADALPLPGVEPPALLTDSKETREGMLRSFKAGNTLKIDVGIPREGDVARLWLGCGETDVDEGAAPTVPKRPTEAPFSSSHFLVLAADMVEG